SVERDKDGRLLTFRGTQAAPGVKRESFIHIHLDPLHDSARRAELVESLEGVLADVRVAVVDWPAMLQRVRASITDLQKGPPPASPEETAEAIAFLEWLANGNFTFLGVRDDRLTGDGELLEPVPESGLGIFRSDGPPRAPHWGKPLKLTPEIKALLKEPSLLIVTKSAVRS